MAIKHRLSQLRQRRLLLRIRVKKIVILCLYSLTRLRLSFGSVIALDPDLGFFVRDVMLVREPFAVKHLVVELVRAPGLSWLVDNGCLLCLVVRFSDSLHLWEVVLNDLT